ncbi:unnamed protein product, partial [Dovyalis caffra]
MQSEKTHKNQPEREEHNHDQKRGNKENRNREWVEQGANRGRKTKAKKEMNRECEKKSGRTGPNMNQNEGRIERSYLLHEGRRRKTKKGKINRKNHIEGEAKRDENTDQRPNHRQEGRNGTNQEQNRGDCTMPNDQQPLPRRPTEGESRGEPF